MDLPNAQDDFDSYVHRIGTYVLDEEKRKEQDYII
jgi:hypothetical protein